MFVPNVVHPNVAVRIFSSIQNSSFAFVMSSSDKVPDIYRNQAPGALFLRTDGASSRVVHEIYIFFVGVRYMSVSVSKQMLRSCPTNRFVTE